MSSCKNKKCGAPLDGTERFCRHCGLAVSGRYITETLTVRGCRTVCTSDGQLLISVSDYLGSSADVRVSVLGHAEMAIKSMVAGQMSRYDAGEDGLFEVRLLSATFFGEGAAEFLVAKKNALA